MLIRLTPNDPAEIYVVIHEETGEAVYQAEVPDPVTEPGEHAATYVPKADLAAARQRIAELEGELAALRIEHEKCPTCVHGNRLGEPCDKCQAPKSPFSRVLGP